MDRFITIGVDGELEISEAAPSVYEAIRRAVGEPGFDMVRLHRTPDLMAYVNDEGLVSDPPAERNPIGACLIWCLGGTPFAYAGPVVFTGFDRASELECVGLTDGQVAMLTAMHRTIQDDLAGPDPSADLAGYAEFVRTTDVTVRIVTYGRIDGGPSIGDPS